MTRQRWALGGVLLLLAVAAGAFAFLRLRQTKPSGSGRPETDRSALTRGPYSYLWIRTVRAPAVRGEHAPSRGP